MSPKSMKVFKIQWLSEWNIWKQNQIYLTLREILGTNALLFPLEAQPFATVSFRNFSPADLHAYNKSLVARKTEGSIFVVFFFQASGPGVRVLPAHLASTADKVGKGLSLFIFSSLLRFSWTYRTLLHISLFPSHPTLCEFFQGRATALACCPPVFSGVL